MDRFARAKVRSPEYVRISVRDIARGRNIVETLRPEGGARRTVRRLMLEAGVRLFSCREISLSVWLLFGFPKAFR